MTSLKLDNLLDQPIPVGAKGLPASAAGMPLAAIGGRGWNVLAGDVPFPLCVLRRSAIDHNRAAMKRFVQEAGVVLAPHGKTTMSPQLFSQQLDDGAWGITAATPAHLQVYRHFGVPRIFYANQLIEPSAVSFVLDERARDPGFEFLCLVDSVAGASLLQQAVIDHGGAGSLDVLIEFGMPGRRCGVRTGEQALALAGEILSLAPALRLRGIEAFEGVVPIDAHGAERVRELLVVMRDTLGAIAERSGEQELIVSAGGSAFFPLIAGEMRQWPNVREIILRSGCYLSNDHGMYARAQSLPETQGAVGLAEPLQPAIEVWGHVQSRPEPGLAIVAIGKRDISNDIEPPRPIKWVRWGERGVRDLGTDLHIIGLNDQHAMMTLPEDHPLAVGDMVALGCSHPCTTFDKWRHLLVVDDDYRVTGAIATFF